MVKIKAAKKVKLAHTVSGEYSVSEGEGAEIVEIYVEKKSMKHLIDVYSVRQNCFNVACNVAGNPRNWRGWLDFYIAGEDGDAFAQADSLFTQAYYEEYEKFIRNPNFEFVKFSELNEPVLYTGQYQKPEQENKKC